MLLAVSMPPSSGVSSVKDNFGGQETKGFELAMSYQILKSEKWSARVGFNAARYKTELTNISSALDRQNQKNAANTDDDKPKNLYKVGQSPNAIYAVRSAGIDPMSGKEIFIKKDGEYTFLYDPQDKVVIGDATPDLQGSFNFSVRYKNVYLYTNFAYTFGGYIYNKTRARKVENIDPRYNVDVRAFTERWKKPGDYSAYLRLKDYATGSIAHTSRFVEENNQVRIANIGIKYDLNKSICKKIGIKKLAIGFSIADLKRWSTVKREIGTKYPFTSKYNFTISPTF